MKRYTILLLLSVYLCSIFSFPAIAGWKQNNTGWWYDKGDGTWFAEQWQWIDGNGDGIAECYYFDQQGYCQTDGITPDGYYVNHDGAWVVNDVVQVKDIRSYENFGAWKYENGRWYVEDIYGSRKTNGWYWLDGNRDGISECYYLDAEGWLLTATITPDGYQVNENGAWIEGDVVKTKGMGQSHTLRGNYTKKNSAKKVYRENFWDDYQDYSTYFVANDFMLGNYGQMTESQIDAVNDRISEFKRNYIKKSMSDFEKEMQIVKWIVENCEYMNSDEEDAWNYGTAYSCIVNGEACCAGYADAFLQMAKACGLSVRYIYNPDHAWNLIELDGEWYHVDVTWEDQGDTWSGESLFINLTDSTIKTFSAHTRWEPFTEAANGIKYGVVAVDWYLQYGNEKFPKGKELKRLENSEENNVIEYHNQEQVIEEIEQYISRQIEQGKETYEYVIKSDFHYEDKESLANIYNLNMQIKREEYGNLRWKYYEIVDLIEDQISYKGLSRDNCYYIYNMGKISYNDADTDTALEECTYKVIYVDADGEVLYTSPVKTAKRDSMVYFDKMNFEDYLPKSGQKFQRKITRGNHTYYIHYEKIENEDEEEKNLENKTSQEDKPQNEETGGQEDRKQEENDKHTEDQSEEEETQEDI